MKTKWLTASASTLIVALTLAACSRPPQDVVIDLSARPGPGRIPTGMSMDGPASDPLDGLRDLTDEVLTGIPDTLTDLDVRFIDFQWAYLVADALRAGRIDSAYYNRYRDPTLNVSLPDEPFDQHVHYAVGRRPSGDFVVVFDTDNDEDLSDEKGLVFPWEGPPMDVRAFFSQVRSFTEYRQLMETLPRVEVAVQLTDGRAVYDDRVLLTIVPHLMVPRPMGPDGHTQEMSAYMIGADGNMVGVAEVGGHEYTFWAGSRRFGAYLPRDTQIWFEEGDHRELPTDSTGPYVPNPFLIGQVVDLGGSYYRLDEIRVDGSELRLVPVDNMPGVGIRPGMEAPGFSSVTLEGDALNLSDYRGKYVLLDFWATSCGPCVEALPELRELYDRFLRDDFDIIGIAQDDPSWLGQFVADNQISWPQVIQNDFEEGSGTILEDYKVTGIPAYFLVDPDGRIAMAGWGAAPGALADSLSRYIAGG